MANPLREQIKGAKKTACFFLNDNQNITINCPIRFSDQLAKLRQG